MKESQARKEPWLANRGWRRVTLVLLVLLLPVLVGAWRINVGDTINPKYVKQIKDGKTTKMEIMTLFGDPQDVRRDANGGITYVYRCYRDAPATPYKPWERKINPQSDQILALNPNHQITKVPLKKKGTILKSTLLVRFKSDGTTVMSHEYKEY
jgi:outer membrane protein assembly factor BamE (lipoprotein component of BamABCDE complex)